MPAKETPLLDYATHQTFAPSERDLQYQQRTREARHVLERNPPPAENCAQTLGASRFANLYDDLGEALDGTGDYGAAVEAYESALECAPRSSYLRVPLSSDLMYLNRYDEARAVAERGLAAEESEAELHAVLAQLDYIAERWDDAISHLRAAAAGMEDGTVAAYFQCLLWLAQRRNGVARPELVSRDDPESWPLPLLAALRGNRTESEVLMSIESEDRPERRRELLAEALYYLGQERLADGDADTARRYMSAMVTLNVHHFVEHHLARAELERMAAAGR